MALQQQQQQLSAASVGVVAVAPAQPSSLAPVATSMQIATTVTKTRQVGTCAFCGNHVGLIFGIIGCGMHKRLHEAKCEQREASSHPIKVRSEHGVKSSV